jgi:hypothetical protein
MQERGAMQITKWTCNNCQAVLEETDEDHEFTHGNKFLKVSYVNNTGEDVPWGYEPDRHYCDRKCLLEHWND